MSCLADALPAFGPDDVAWHLPGGGAVRAGALARALADAPVDALRGRAVAVGALPPAELAATLALLDGVAAAIVLAPADGDAPVQAPPAEVFIDGAGLGLAAAAARGGPDRRDAADARRGAPVPTRWLLPTSGTTGTPRMVEHTFASLTRRLSRRRTGPATVWGSLYGARRFAGLQVLLQAWLSASPLVLRDDGEPVERTVARLRACGCTALSATPSMWRRLSMVEGFARLPLAQVTLGGEIADQPVLDLLAASFPRARVIHVYASTEAGVGFTVRDGRAGFPAALLAPREGAAPDLRVDDDGRLWLRRGDGGGDGSGGDGDGPEAWLDSGDVVAVDGDRVRFLGRASGSINVGGNKVMPEEIEAVIRELPDIAEVVVRPRRSGLLGQLVEAAVEPAPGRALDAALTQRLVAHCRARLAAYKVPAFVVPLRAAWTPAGKLARRP